MKLTRAQRETLLVLNTVGGRVRASKRMSCVKPYPNVNYIAGGALARLGLVKRIMPDFERGYTIDSGVPIGMSCTDLFELTDEGRALVATMLRRSPTARAPAG